MDPFLIREVTKSIASIGTNKSESKVNQLSILNIQVIFMSITKSRLLLLVATANFSL